MKNHTAKKALFLSVIVAKDAEKKLKTNQSQIQEFEFVVTNPSTKNSNNDDWSDGVMVVADGAPGKIRVKLQGETKGTVKHPLKSATLKKALRAFHANMFSKAVAITTTGESIDLIKNRLRDKITVDMLGKYPNARSVENEFNNVFDRQSSELDEYLP